MAAMIKQVHGEAPLYMLQPKALFNFASQTLEFVSQTLGYHDSATYTTTRENECTSNFTREKDEESGLDMYSLSEVAVHDTFDDCWIIVHDKVFDVTRFLLEHPGGEDVILENGGRDATLAFRSAGHSAHAFKALDDFVVGILRQEERIYTGKEPSSWSSQ